ncbi:beta-lactamase class A [Franzmannia pantelleriensis]|uniref:beta-lactamase n=1 Tax=Franzmannia pantelleriensis TaxID=48727 RepID=A0A1G9M525_9GAMM|nr:serine hydrolase [Halomonas pantelleriensis]SDL69298.1 beta-lactamase class A [Halomonas pantelleriensis]
MIYRALCCMTLLLASVAVYADEMHGDWYYQVDKRSAWQTPLEGRLAELERDFAGELGVYVQDLHSGEALSWQGERQWYLASLIKVPVAVEVFARRDEGTLSLDERMTLTRSDYVDGAGQTNWQEPGSRLTLGFLLDEMLTVSDNTASDMLIRRVGLAASNRRAREMVAAAGGDPDQLGEITSLLEVRRALFGELHPDARELGGMDYIALRHNDDLGTRVAAFAERLGLAPGELALDGYDAAFDAYEAGRLNTGTLAAFGDLLATLVRGGPAQAGLSDASREALLTIMQRTSSGEARLKAGFGDDVRFAHKTGTQHRRTCDAGIAHRGEAREVAVVACTRGPIDVVPHERLLAEVGAAIEASGVLSLPVPSVD